MKLKLRQAAEALPQRAEKLDPEVLQATFNDVGGIGDTVLNVDNKIIYGRRGSGKTHALLYQKQRIIAQGDLAVFIDLRKIGSNVSLYRSDQNSDYRVRKFAFEFFQDLHNEILNELKGRNEPPFLADYAQRLNNLIDEINSVYGSTEQTVEEHDLQANERNRGENFGVDVHNALKFSFKTSDLLRSENKRSQIIKRSELLSKRLNYGSISKILDSLMKENETRLWVLLDEWSAVPEDIQPYLADVIRRCLFPVGLITVHIAAIEQRTNLYLPGEGDYIGIEIGADASTALNLDDFLVFDNDPSLSTEFFQNLLFKHLSQFDLEDEEKPTNAVNMRTRIFNKKETFEELVRASEGVPRDAINLLAKASRKAKSAKVNISNVRAAALEWFQQDKSSFLSANRDADIFLRWLMEKVIGERQARAFLISVDDRLRAIDTLYDQRLLHILKRSVSSKDEPGKRFIVYKLDYGCYVNLKDTNKNPKGLLADVDDAGNEIFIEVPKDDYRSIRRTIVNVSEFNIERMQKIIEETEIKLGEFSAHLFMDVSISRMLRQTKELFGDTRSNTKSSKGHQLDLFHTRDE